MSIMETSKPINCCNSNYLTCSEDLFDGVTGAGLVYTDILNLSKSRECHFIISKNAGATGTATITVESCDDVTPTTATAVAFKYRVCTSGDTWGAWTAATSTGFTTTAGANQMYQICVKSNGLSGTNEYVRLKATEGTDSPCDGSIIALLAERRYNVSIPATDLT